MKILAVSDEENNILWSDRIKEHVQGTELIISCGDLRSTYLEFLVTMLNIPLLYVHGNHDKSGPEGGICIDGKIYCISGLSIMGLGGSMRYREGRNMYTEREMRIRIMKLFPFAMLKGIDILVTHSPPKDYGDMQDLPHKGFDSFNFLLNFFTPSYMLHGHIHKSYGRIQTEHIHSSGTRIINVCGYRIIEV